MKALLFAVFLSVIQATPPIPRQAPDSSTSTTGKSQSQANPQKTPPAQTESPVNANQTPSDDARRGEPRDHNAEHAITVSKLPPVTVSSPHRDWADWGTW